MMKHHRAVMILAAALLLSACASSPPVRFYTLATPQSAEKEHLSPPTNSSILIEIPPTTVPERLARPQLVIRTEGSHVEFLEQERWATPFNIELHEVLANQITQKLGAFDVTRLAYSSLALPSQQRVYRLATELRQLEAIKGNKVEALFGWTLTQSDNNGALICQISLTKAINQGTDALVQGIQQIVNEAASAMAESIRSGRDERCFNTIHR